jgi:hypothetical protein
MIKQLAKIGHVAHDHIGLFADFQRTGAVGPIQCRGGIYGQGS